MKKYILLILISFFIRGNELQATSSYLLNRHDDWNMLVTPPANIEKGEIKIAGLNIQTAFVSDKPENLAKYPQYAWSNREKPFLQLISLDQPTVLAMSELHLKQIQSLRALKGYKIAAFSSESKEPIEVVEEKVSQDAKYNYGEFVGFLYNSNQVRLDDINCIELEKGERHKRVLIIGRFYHTLLKVNFVVLSSHFDHLSLSSRQLSGETELAIIQQLEEQGIPWFSVGDRNWFPGIGGQDCAEQYIKKPYIIDFRDETEKGHFGPSGTFPGHLGLPQEFEPRMVDRPDGKKQIEAYTFDVGFRSRSTVIAINDYAYSGEFSPDTYDLLPLDQQGPIQNKNFLSDHYYIGGTFRFRQ